jgi:hypothetical protein
LEHGFVTTRTLFSKGKIVWDFIQEALNSPDIIATVEALTEQAPYERVKVFLEIALVQQSIGNHMNCFFLDDILVEKWYHSNAIMRDPDYRSGILGLLQGLNRLEFNIHVKERRYASLNSKMSNVPSISQIGALFSKGDQVMKTSFLSTMDTIGKVQHQVVETAQYGVQSILLGADKDSPSDGQKNDKKIELLERELKEEKAQRMAIEVELIGLKMSKEKDFKKLQQEESRGHFFVFLKSRGHFFVIFPLLYFH